MSLDTDSLMYHLLQIPLSRSVVMIDGLLVSNDNVGPNFFDDFEHLGMENKINQDCKAV